MGRPDQRRAAMVALYQLDVTGRPIDDLIPKNASSFTHDLIDGVLEFREELDELIARFAKGWSLERIAPLERAILRVAIFEMLHRDDVPDEVAIDEAVEAAKELCAAEAPGFINGILGAVKQAEVTPQ